MLRINPILQNKEIQNINNAKNINFKGAEPLPAQTVTAPMSVTPTYNVKKPMAYQQLEDLELAFDKKAKQYKLANGQQVLIFPKEGRTVLKTYVNTGSMNEPDNVRGISHFIEHNLFNGSEGLEAGEFFKTVDDMGAQTNASTSFSTTDYYIASNRLNDEDFEKQMKIHASMLESPLFLFDKLEKEKGVVNQEINMYMGYSDNLAINNSIKKLFNINTSSPDLIAGTTNNITNLTRDDVVNYFNNNYYPSNMVTVITGEVDPDETMKLVSKYFTSTKQPPNARYHEQLTQIDKTVREDIISDKATATSIVMGFKGPQNNALEDTIFMEAATRILCSGNNTRLTKALEKYNTELWINVERIGTKPETPTVMLMQTETTEENSEKVLKEIYKGVQSLSSNPPTEKEMTIVKKQMLKRLSERYEYSSSINNLIGAALLDKCPDYLNKYEKIVNEMTPQDIVKAAQKHFDLNKTAITVMHPDTANEKTIQDNYKNAISFTGAVQQNQNSQLIDTKNIKQYKLDNNYRVALNNTNSKKADFAIYIQPENLSQQKTAALFIWNKILAEGTANKTKEEFNENLDLNATEINVTGYYGGIVGDGDCNANDLQSALKSFTEVIASPRITEETLEKAKQDLRTSISIREKNVMDKLDKEVFKDLPLGVTSDEILASLDDVTLDDIKNLHYEIINKSVGSVVVSAPFEKMPELKNIVFENFSQLPKINEPKILFKDIFKPITETKVLTDTHPKNQAEAVECFKFKVNKNMKDEMAIKLLSEILGGGTSSRLFNDLREEQKLAYWVRSSYNNHDNIGTFALSIGTTTEDKEAGITSYDNIEKSINGFNKHIQKLLNEKVTEEELEAAKLKFKDSLMSIKEGQERKTNRIIDSINGFYGEGEINKEFAMLDEITTDDIYNAAQYIFKNKPTYSIIATPDTLENNKEFLNSLCA